MTLKELLNLKVVKDNVMILVFDDEYMFKYHEYSEKYNVLRIMGRAVLEEDLVKAGVREELFNYKVRAMWGSDCKYKMGIVIEKI